MADWLKSAGCDAIHTFQLPHANRTTDQELVDLADSEQRIVVTKDADFVDSHLIHKRPSRLLLISTGNIRNRELELLVLQWIPDIVREFASCSFAELGIAGLVVRG